MELRRVGKTDHWWFFSRQANSFLVYVLISAHYDFSFHCGFSFYFLKSIDFIIIFYKRIYDMADIFRKIISPNYFKTSKWVRSLERARKQNYSKLKRLTYLTFKSPTRFDGKALFKMNLQGYHLKETTSQTTVNPVMSENKVSNHWHLSWCISTGKERKWMKKNKCLCKWRQYPYPGKLFPSTNKEKDM